jgi:hypothetical protein
MSSGSRQSGELSYPELYLDGLGADVFWYVICCGAFRPPCAASTLPTPPATCCLSLAWYAPSTLLSHFLSLAKCPSIPQLKELAYALGGGLSRASAAGNKPCPAAPDTEPAPAVASAAAAAASAVDYSIGHTRFCSPRNAGTALTAAHSTAVLPRSSTADRSCTASLLWPLLLLRLLRSKLFLLLSPLLVFLLLNLRKLLERLLLILRQIIPR